MTLEPSTVIVGKNNAGKSSVIEAMRLLAAVVNRKGATFVQAPRWVDLPRFRLGIAPRISQLGINLSAVFHRYGDPPATITATFIGGAVVTVYVGREETIFATVHADGDWVTTGPQFLRLKLPWVCVLPQIGPLLTEEHRLTDDRVAAYLNSRLSSRHFRNQLIRMGETFDEFKRLAAETWHGLRVDRIQESQTNEGVLLSLPVRDGDFVAEVGWMGHGLQMWLQTIWFLSRTTPECTVVLDEPDVYMHPDLQRRLYRLARNRFRQCIIATHSVEIMAESDPGNILIIDKKQRHAVLYPAADLPLDAIPVLPVGGWSGWPYAVGSSMTLKNAVGDRITPYCILDSDYHSDSEICDRYKEAVDRGVQLHVWSRKEIENYLLNPQAIRRVLQSRIKDRSVPTAPEVWSKILEICDHERRTVEDGIASALVQANRKLDLITANRMARSRVDEIWKTEANRPKVVSGKDILSKLSAWTQQEFGSAFGAAAVARQITASGIPTELANVVAAIEDGSGFLSFEERMKLHSSGASGS